MEGNSFYHFADMECISNGSVDSKCILRLREIKKTHNLILRVFLVSIFW
jgi:hypothetical protein